MNESDAIAVIAAAWTVVQVTRATYAHLAKKHAADRAAAIEPLKAMLKEKS